MKFHTACTRATIFLSFLAKSVAACPFSKTADEMPSDSTHNRLRGSRRMLASLSEDDTTRGKLAAIISKQKRSLQNNCVSTGIYEGIRAALEEMSDAITDLGDRGHFIGGIVRLAAVSTIAICIFILKTCIICTSVTDHHHDLYPLPSALLF